jgi:hypothetical protein
MRRMRALRPSRYAEYWISHRSTIMKPARYEITFITQAFRDVADRDYLAARILHRSGLDLPFLWSGLQALEKYLKAILLYNGRDTRRLSHHLVRALDAVLAIDDISFDFPDDLKPFLEFLEVYGADRYLQHPYHTHGEELFQLDRAVGHVRRYCQFLRGDGEGFDGTVVPLLPARLGSIQSERFRKNPRQFAILGGHLEEILKDKRSPLRAHLVWQNLYFGAGRRRTIGSYWRRSVSVIPVHFLQPELFAVLRTRVDFPKTVAAYFDGLSK